MCLDCYAAYGSPKIVTKATKAAAALVSAVYDRHPSGGAGHIVFEDFNVGDDDVSWCIDNGNDMDDTTMAALEAFCGLTEPERMSALAIHEGWLT